MKELIQLNELLSDRIPNPRSPQYMAIRVRSPGSHSEVRATFSMDRLEDAQKYFQTVWNDGKNNFLDCWLEHCVPVIYPSRDNSQGQETKIVDGSFRSTRKAKWFGDE